MADDLRSLEQTVSEALAVLGNSQGEEAQKAEARAQIERLYSEQLQTFNDPSRSGLHNHPAISLLQDRLNDTDPLKRAEAVLMLGYFNSLSAGEGGNRIFPGYNTATQHFDGADGLPTLQRTLQEALTQAQEAAFHQYAGKTAPTLPDLHVLSAPSGVVATQGITVERVMRDLASFDDAAGVNRIAAMRQQLSEQGTVNPYQYALMELATQIKGKELEQMGSAFQSLTGGDKPEPFNREAFIREQFPQLFKGLTLTDQSVAVSDIGRANSLDALHQQDLQEGLRARMSASTLVIEAKDLSDNDGFMPWALQTYLANRDDFKGPDDVQKLFTDPDRIVRLLKDAPGMTEEHARNMAQHARFFGTYSKDFEGAQNEGLTLGQFRQHQQEGTRPFLAQYVAQSRGAEIVPAHAAQADAVDPNFRADESGGPYQFKVPILGGVQASGETLSTSLLTDGDGDGLRLGMMNFQGTLDVPAPELYFRHTIDPVGRFELGLLGHQDGDTDGQIRTSRPWVDDHFEGHRGILGLRYTGNDFKIGSGSLTPYSTVGAEHGDLFANGGLTLQQGLSDSILLRSGVSGTYADRPRVDAFGEVSANLTQNFNLGSDTYWRTGVHATHWLEPDDHTLGTAYTELELNSSGDHWYSNLRHVFGAYVNTDENFGVYTDHTKRFDLGPLGTPDAGFRLQYDREDDFQAGVVAGWRF